MALSMGSVKRPGRRRQPSHAIENFRIAAGRSQGEFYGMVFQDSDVAKWLEAVAWMLCQQPDARMEHAADEVIELIAAAQQPDGYLNTFLPSRSRISDGPTWRNVMSFIAPAI